LVEVKNILNSYLTAGF